MCRGLGYSKTLEDKRRDGQIQLPRGAIGSAQRSVISDWLILSVMDKVIVEVDSRLVEW